MFRDRREKVRCTGSFLEGLEGPRENGSRACSIDGVVAKMGLIPYTE